ncbi:MAG TPA: hypothetical protein VHS53_08935, partial [Mucilaginibacter sp.]|nr:hypothetical protein [Mucilaginibacter sp.]
MIPYILHVALLISISLLFYKIFLQRETFYKLNRMILLICLGLSFVLPMITVPEAWTLRSAPERPVVGSRPQTVTEMYPEITAQVQKQIQAAEKQTVKTPAQPVAKPEPVKAQPAAAAPLQDKPIW